MSQHHSETTLWVYNNGPAETTAYKLELELAQAGP